MQPFVMQSVVMQPVVMQPFVMQSDWVSHHAVSHHAVSRHAVSRHAVNHLAVVMQSLCSQSSCSQSARSRRVETSSIIIIKQTTTVWNRVHQHYSHWRMTPVWTSFPGNIILEVERSTVVPDRRPVDPTKDVYKFPLFTALCHGLYPSWSYFNPDDRLRIIYPMAPQ